MEKNTSAERDKKKAVLAFTDGYELTMSVYPELKEAQRAMQEGFNRCYDPKFDEYNESYCNEMAAKVVRSGEEIWIWGIALC